MKLNKETFLKNARIIKREESTKENYLEVQIFDVIFFVSEHGIYSEVPIWIKKSYVSYKNLIKFV